MATPVWLKTTPARYVMAGLITALALFAARGIRPFLGDLSPFVTALPVITFVIWYCGFGPSLMVVILTVFDAKYSFFPITHSIQLLNAGELVSFFAFLFVSAGIITLGEASRRENEKLRMAHGDLEETVNQRTEALDEANRSLSELTARLLQSQDDERRRIARDLHDSLGQTMTVLGLNLSVIQTELERLMNTINTVKDSQELVRETSANIRTISYLLHPPLLDESGLSLALPWYVEGFSERSKIKVELELPEDLVRLPRDSEIAIFRLVQECLTNIHRHSGSDTATIHVTHTKSDICVEVKDQGNGIPSEKLQEMRSGGTPGVGIRGMRERVRQLGGSLRIDSQGRGKGTVIIAHLPLIHSEQPVGTSAADISEPVIDDAVTNKTNIH